LAGTQLSSSGPAGGDGSAPTAVISPSEELPAPDEGELATLRQIGRRWASVLIDDPERFTRLPVNPALGRFSLEPAPTRFGRFARILMFRPGERGELVATEQATEESTRSGRALAALKRAIVGPPLASSAVVQERMRKLVALAVLSSDVLSSVAYGPEAMLTALVAAGSGALSLSLPLGGALVLLMIAVGMSYRQTIRAYPNGAGSYIVASDNLGEVPGLCAAIGLMFDYVLTVSVSIAAGVAAITSALPEWRPLAVPMGLLVIAVLLAGNLRGVRQAGNLFAAPSYAFMLAMYVLIAVALAQAAQRGFSPVPPPPIAPTEALSAMLILRAFASGASSMTGIEAVSNAIPAFHPPEWRNARTTLSWMVVLLVTMFSGLTLSIHLNGLVPSADETVLSQLAHRTFGPGPLYGYVQATTAVILLLAANTAFNDFPRLLYYMARQQHAPRIFLRMGDRLAFSNGILMLAVTAAAIFTIFKGQTESLIPLYAVGVFLAFTLSQVGMVVHWWRRRQEHWRLSLFFNALGGGLSAVVLLTAAVTKFTEGAWIVVIGIPLLVWTCLRIRDHYRRIQRVTALHEVVDVAGKGIVPARPNVARRELEESPDEIRHLLVTPIAQMNLPALRALAYAASLGQPVLAVHLSPEEEEARRFRRQWQIWGNHLPLEVLVSPYRAVVPPLVHYLRALRAQRPNLVLTVIIPEIVVRSFWQRLLHSQLGDRLRRTLRLQRATVVTTVPFHLPE